MVKIAAYAQGYLYPTPPPAQPVETTISQIQQSGFDTIILGLFHIGAGPNHRFGDLLFNDTPIIASGDYVGDPNWPQQVGELVGGSVSTVGASIGGGGVADYQTIATIYYLNGKSFAGTNLELNLQAFAGKFPAIKFIDLDCENTYDQESFTAFCLLLTQIGFGLTFCPYDVFQMSFWTGAQSGLTTGANFSPVLWWNLQIYGGSGKPTDWAEAIRTAIPGFNTDGFIVAGFSSNNSSPDDVATQLQGFADEASLGGAFIWTIDHIIEQNDAGALEVMQSYVAKINANFPP